MRTFIIPLMLMICTCLKVQAQYSDALAFEAKGPVKTITENGTIWKFDQTGKLVEQVNIGGALSGMSEITVGNDMVYKVGEHFWTKHDSKGRLTERRSQPGWAQTGYLYDNWGRLYRCYDLKRPGEETTYFYNSDGSVKYKIMNTVINEDVEIGTPFNYGYYEFDSHGNWIKRSHIIDFLGNVSISQTYEREITYW